MSEHRPLEGNVIIVTGAGGGIGEAIALAAARAGARVVVNDVSLSLRGDPLGSNVAEDVVEKIKLAGGVAVASRDSVSEPSTAQRIVDTALSHFGRLDGVVNNAGIVRDVLFHKMSYEEWDTVLKVHLYGSFNVSRAAATVFREQNFGRFVHMTSTSGLIGNLGQANYMAAKLGVVALSKSIALDMERFDVCSNCIAPFAWSRMTSSLPTTTPAQIARVQKMQQMTPESVAPLVVALLSKLSPAVTGQIFAVRKNEIFLFNQPRPVRSAHRSGGWTPETLIDHGLPSLSAHYSPLERSENVFTWDPI